MIATIENVLFDKDLVLEQGNTQVRILRPDDIEELKHIACDLSIWKYFTLEISNQEELQNYVDDMIRDFEAKKIVPFVIIDKKENKIVGMSAFGNISIKDKRLEIGWSWLSPSSQGTGINKRYKDLLVGFVFKELDFIRVEFKTDVLNIKARRALVKIGATEEGVLRSHTLMHHDRRRDTIYYSILKDEWNR